MLEAIKNRRSRRDFDSSKTIEDYKLEEVIKAGLLAPSGMNRQDTKIIVVKNKEVKDKLAKLNASIMGSNTDPFYNAPIVLLVISKKGTTSIQDGSAVIENMLLEATNNGLATCWIHRAKEEIESKEIYNIFPNINLDFNDYIGVGHVAIGYSLNNNEVKEKEIKKNRVILY